MVLRVEGSARALLTAERTALNFLQRLSGVATVTAKVVARRCREGAATILDTRKTTPGLRGAGEGGGRRTAAAPTTAPACSTRS